MIEDAEIIRRCRQGQMGLMDILVDRYKIELFSLCMRLARTKPDADDLFQDTWVRAMKRLDSYSLEYGFKTWIFAICTNRYRDLYRRRRRWMRRLRGNWGMDSEEETLARIEAPAAGPEETVLQDEQRAAVKQALAALDDAFRLPVVLHYFHGCSTAEIGAILEIPAGTVKSRLFKGRELLKTLLEDRGYER